MNQSMGLVAPLMSNWTHEIFLTQDLFNVVVVAISFLCLRWSNNISSKSSTTTYVIHIYHIINMTIFGIPKRRSKDKIVL